MTREDIPRCMDLKRAANWNQLEQDWQLLLDAGQNNFVAVHKGKVVGSVTSINYSNRFSWIGMILVDPGMRGAGIGTRLLKAAVNSSVQGTIRLDATPKGKELYDALGFKVEYELSRYQRLEPLDVALIPKSQCRSVAQKDLAQIIEFDKTVFGANRDPILAHLLGMAPDYAWLTESEGRMTGYCMGRAGSNFEQIGPIVAQSEETAQSLLLHALSRCGEKPVIVDSIDRHRQWNLFLEEIGFECQRPFIRMYLGEHSFPGKPESLFAIAGPEMG